MVRTSWIFCFLLVAFVSCEPSSPSNSHSDLKEIESFISLLDSDLMVLEKEIINLAKETEALYAQADHYIPKADKAKFSIQNRVANASPNANPAFSTLFISTLAQDQNAIMDLVYLTEPLDSSFKEIVSNHPMVSQVYFNSPLHLNRLYPPYDAGTMLDPSVDLTSFNFYYEANEINNPEKGPVWINEIYLDPVGRGWMISLIHPVYHKGELQMVLGFDITVNDILEFYLNRYSNQIVIVDEGGTVVAGKAKAIEALSLPPLTNHTYIQTITSNYFRMQDYNLFKSKSREVRKMASQFLLVQDKEFLLEDGLEDIMVHSKKMDRLNWYILDLQL